ncbi:guanine nucleotide-binding protein-like protein [Novymonas esmeraldas]|uniref:Guanine nucleotide-binding protein-like 1 n=1 Tax=Novymonas esmeraldas TaxID=1808958 RepID=A0AAW0ELY0_9TRYP
MPPFSGKKKKEQLQEKRQRKRDEEERAKVRDREREQLRGELVERGEDASHEVVEAILRERSDMQDPARGRRARQREREAAAAAATTSTHPRASGAGAGGGVAGDGHESGSSASSGHRDGSDGAKPPRYTSHAAATTTTMMYSADRQHGVRSIFAKESAAAVAARKKLGYQPIPYRTRMPPTGIPFGEWFSFPTSAAEQSNTASASPPPAAPRRGGGGNSAAERTQPSAGEKAAEIAAEQQRRMERPLVASAGDALGGVPGSTFFPFAVELPSRGWRSGGDGEPVVTDDARTLLSHAAAPTDEATEEAAAASGTAPATALDDVARIKSVEGDRFQLYMRSVDAYPLPASLIGLEVSSYERNIEVWQQLWRTVELCDVLVVVADARYPIVHAHLGLLTYIAKEQRKPCVFVLNKEDLVPASTLRRWQHFLYRYLTDLHFSVEPPAGAAEEEQEEEPPAPEQRDGVETPASPAAGRIVLRTFTANPRAETAGQRDGDVDVLRRQRGRKKAGAHMYEKLRTGRLNATKHLSRCGAGVGDEEEDDSSDEDDALHYDASENFVGMRAAQHALLHDRRAYKELGVVADAIAELLATCRRLGGVTTPQTPERGGEDAAAAATADHPSHLHIGFIGHPNVGKSSLLNCIRGTKVVSVSATPGHTKHVQTIPVPEEHVTLVDSPGLALPVLGVPHPLQAVLGTHQIAQTRDPQTGVSFLAAYLPIETSYGLLRPDYAVGEDGWSSYELCEAYAKKRGYVVKHGKGALDIHRAAIALLQEAYEGRLAVFYAPPELNLLQSAWYRERVRPHLLLPVFKPALLDTQV